MTALSRFRNGLWVCIWIFFVLYAPVIFVSGSTGRYRHTYELPRNSPGTLTSDFWSFDWWFSSSMFLMLLLPFSASFMLNAPSKEWRRNMHVFFCISLALYFLPAACVWSYNVHWANYPASWNALNPANSQKWCCINRVIAPTVCLNDVPCTGVTQSNLFIYGYFLIKFVGTWVFVVLCVLEIFVVFYGFIPAVEEFQMEKGLPTSGGQEGFTDPPTPSAPPLLPAAAEINSRIQGRRGGRRTINK